ncbi:GerAB/ArcD/ProY family transporter [Oikeobacillus pervagus]|nr:endospore germination permease [Oikeobacillus pervagus]
MNTNGPISLFQLILLAVTALGLKVHVLIIDPLIDTAGRDAWISLILVLFVSIIWAILLIYIHKGTNQAHLFTWLNEKFGKVVSFLFAALLYLFLIIIGAVTLKDTVVWTKVTYLQNTPSFVLVGLFLFLCAVAALTGLRGLAIANFFILFFVIIFGFFVSFTNMQFKSFSLLLPVLEHGFQPVIKGSIYPLSGMTELFMFIIFQHRVKEEIKFKHLVLTAFLLFWLAFGPTIGAITEFGPSEASNQRFSAYEQWGLASLGRFIEHLDFLSIYQWLSGAFIRISLIFILILEIFSTKKQKATYFLFIIMIVALFVFCLLPISDIIFYRLLKNVILPFSFYFFASITLLIGLFVFISKRKEESQ